jgi:hypothetical protein
MRAGRDLSSAGMMQENPYFTGDPGRNVTVVHHQCIALTNRLKGRL